MRERESERERERESSKESLWLVKVMKKEKTVCEKHKRPQFKKQMGIHFLPHTVFHKYNGNDINKNQTKSSETELRKVQDICTTF